MNDYEEYIASYHGMCAPLTREQFNQKFQPNQIPNIPNLETISQILNSQLQDHQRELSSRMKDLSNAQTRLKEINESITFYQETIQALKSTLTHLNLEIKS